jgi:HEPN domain-containing protein
LILQKKPNNVLNNKVFRKSDGYIPENLWHWADNHLSSARYLFHGSPTYYDSAGYLSHLGLELLLKAVLLDLTGEFPGGAKGHKILSLYEEIKRRHRKFELSKEDYGTLNMLYKFYELRYPRPTRNVEIGSDDWGKIKTLYESIVDRMPKRLKNKFRKVNFLLKNGRILAYKAKSKK